MRVVHTITELGAGEVATSADTWDLRVPATDDRAYHDAQFADYHLPARDFRWRPGVRLRLNAQFSTADLRGTAGFGFWNHPFSPDMRGLPRPPQAAWFFYSSPPNNMPLALGVPGSGWKAATINARRPAFWMLLPFALPGFLLMRLPPLYRALWPLGQWSLGVREAALPRHLMTSPTRYGIDWEAQALHFSVNEQRILSAPFRLGGPLGFIAWIDNQYAVVTPQGQFGWGLVGVSASQSLRVWDLSLR